MDSNSYVRIENTQTQKKIKPTMIQESIDNIDQTSIDNPMDSGDWLLVFGCILIGFMKWRKYWKMIDGKLL